MNVERKTAGGKVENRIVENWKTLLKNGEAWPRLVEKTPKLPKFGACVENGANVEKSVEK